MHAIHIQRLIALPYLVLGLWCLLAPHMVERLMVTPAYQHLSPTSALLIGCFELARCVEVPYRVAINEAVELAKSFGGTDGHKYVNGVLDRCGAQLRPDEAGAGRNRRPA